MSGSKLLGSLRALVVAVVMTVAAVGFAMAPAVSAASDYLPVSLTVSGGEASQVLTMIAKMGKLSMVADSSVKGPVSISLKSVPLDVALDLICRSNSWIWSRIGDTIVVTDAAKAAKDAALYGETEVIHLKYAEPAEVAAKLALVIPAERTKVDVRTNSVVITGSGPERAKVHQLVKSLDIPIPQVNVIARVEEISKDAIRRLGIQWDVDGKAITLGYDAGKYQLSLGYGTLLNALESNGDATSLANSSISTLDGQEANILAGEKIPVVKEDVVDGKVVKTYEMVEVGVKLRILPKINVEDKTVTIKLTPEVSNSPRDVSGMPRISTREASTIISIKDGETRALGGLFQKRDEIITKRVPVLGYIPIIGGLFTTKEKITKESEIIVFITPKIISPDVPQDLKSDMRESALDTPAKTGSKATKAEPAKATPAKAPAPAKEAPKEKAATAATAAQPQKAVVPPPVPPAAPAPAAVPKVEPKAETKQETAVPTVTAPAAKVEEAPAPAKEQTTATTLVASTAPAPAKEQAPATTQAVPVASAPAKEQAPTATQIAPTAPAPEQPKGTAPAPTAPEVQPEAKKETPSTEAPVAVNEAVEAPKRTLSLVARVERVRKTALARVGLSLPPGANTYDGVKDGNLKLGLGLNDSIELLNKTGDSKSLANTTLTVADGAEASITFPGELDPSGRMMVNGGVLKVVPKVIGGAVSLGLTATGYDAAGKDAKVKESRTSVTFSSGEIKAVGGLYVLAPKPRKGFFAWLFGIQDPPDSEVVIILTPTLNQ